MKLALMLIILMVLGCSQDTCEVSDKICVDKGLDEDCCPRSSNLSQSPGQPSIRKVNLFFDASGSMAGYMPSSQPSTMLQMLIPDLISRLKSEYPDGISFYPIYNSSSSLSPMDISQAEQQMREGRLSRQTGDTYLPAMLDTIYRNFLHPEAVNIFISDCIYSPAKGQKKQAEQAAKEIREDINRYAGSFYTTVFCLRSEFLRYKKNLQVNKSPYYLLVFGKPENNHEVEQIIVRAVDALRQPFDLVHYGWKWAPPHYSILQYTDQTGNCIINPCNSCGGAFANIVVEDERPKDEPIRFWIGLDLTKYPSYATSPQYLKSNLVLTISQGSARILDIKGKAPETLAKDDQAIARSVTHFIQIEISEIADCIASLDIALKFSRPGWITQLNENELEENREKTFGLERMMNGFEQAYNSGEAYFFRGLRISFTKQ